MDEIIVEVQAAEATAAGAKPVKKGKKLPSDRDKIVKAAGDYFHRFFPTSFSGGSVLRICRPSLSQSSTIGSRYPPGIKHGMRSIGLCETQTTVSSKPNPEAPIAPPSELDPCHLASSPEAPELDPCHLVSSLPQAQVVETQTTTEPKATFAEAAAKITPCHLLESLSLKVPCTTVNRILLNKFLECLGTLLSEVSFRWDDMFKEPVWSKLFHDVIDLSQIPESFYNILVEWIDRHIGDRLLLPFVFWTFRYITESVWEVYITESVWELFPSHILVTESSNVSILVAAALVLRSRPSLLLEKMGALHDLQLHYEQLGALTTPLAVWMIAQVSEGDSLLGLRLWALLLVPLLDRSNDQSKDLILELVENIINKKPDFTVKILHGFPWVTFPSFEILLRFTFPASQEATTRRFVAIYPIFKDMFLVAPPQYLFPFCLRLDNQGNPDVAKEATEIAFWCLTQEVDCWESWDYLCNTENLETSSVALLKRLIEKLKDHSLQLSFLSPGHIRALIKHWRKRNNIKKVSFSQKIFEEAIQEVKIQQEAMEQEVKLQQVKIFTQKLLTFSLRLAGEGNSVLANEATEIAIWSLTESVVWWKLWECLYKENLEASSVAILKKLVENWKDHSLKLSSWSLNHTLARAPDSKEMQLQVTQKIFTEKIFTFSLRIAGRGNPDLAKETIEMAIWSLMENVDCWKHWEYLYKKNLEASVALLKKLVEKWKDRSLKPSSSPSDILEKIYTLSLRLAGEGNHVLAKEAAEFAIWSLAEKNDPYKKNRKAVVALLKKPIDKWKDHSLKQLSSAILALSQTMKRLKKKKAITQGGANGSLYKEAAKPYNVIWGRLSRGSCSLKGTWIVNLVLIIAVAVVCVSVLF